MFRLNQDKKPVLNGSAKRAISRASDCPAGYPLGAETIRRCPDAVYHSGGLSAQSVACMLHPCRRCPVRSGRCPADGCWCRLADRVVRSGLLSARLAEVFDLPRPRMPHLTTWTRVFGHAVVLEAFEQVVAQITLPPAPPRCPHAVASRSVWTAKRCGAPSRSAGRCLTGATRACTAGVGGAQ